MASYNQQQSGQEYGLNNSHGGDGGEYNNDAAAANQQKQEFVTPSLCIPRTHANIRKERIFAVIRSLGLGWIGRIDVVEKKDEKTGTPFIRVFIHFTKWFQNAQTRQFLEHLETQKSANIVYDEPWFWKVTKSFVPAPMPHHQQQQQQQQPSRFPKPRIDFAGASTTRVQQAEQEQEQQVAATVSSKTPSSNASGTNAVSGKGKQVAKRMGYESGKGLGKKADGRLVPVQIKKISAGMESDSVLLLLTLLMLLLLLTLLMLLLLLLPVRLLLTPLLQITGRHMLTTGTPKLSF